MLGDLKVVEDKLYQPEALSSFLEKYSVHQAIKQLNKATKKETKDRLKYFLSKVGQSNQYRQLLLACLTEKPAEQKQFGKYVASENSEQFFTLLVNNPEEVLQVIQTQPTMLPTLIKLVAHPHGIKLVKLFRVLYTKYQRECLFSPEVKAGLAEGLGFGQENEGVDTVAQMRYLEIVVDMAVQGGPCFDLAEGLLQKGLSLYKTEDILLKMAMSEVIAGLGKGDKASKVLREHSIWKDIEKDACDVQQQLYVKKFLLVLLVDMSNNGHYQIGHKVTKHIHQFLRTHLKSKGEELQAAIDLITHLFKTAQGSKIIIQNTEVLENWVALSRSTQDAAKGPFVESVASLVHLGCESSKQAKGHPKYRLAINVLNCIGKPNMVGEISHNLHSNNYVVYGLGDFAQWFVSKLQLPFEDAELTLLEAFHQLLNYYEVAEALLQVQEVTKYLLRPVGASNKQLKAKKANLLATIVGKGKNDWDGLELAEYSRNLQKLLEGQKKESVYALDVE